MKTNRKYSLVAMGALIIAGASCVQLAGFSDNYALESDASESEDGSEPDGTINVNGDATTSQDGGTDAETNLDAGADSGAVVYLDWTDAGAWTVNQVAGMGASYVGGTFDGRYVYFTPTDHTSKVLRYDTTLPFTAVGSFTAFDAPGMLGTQGFYGAAFDGRYVYFAGGNAASGTPYLSARYDTKGGGGFTALASWEKFDTRILTPDAGLELDAGDAGDAATQVGDQGFGGTFYDGTGFVYFVPFGTGEGATQGIVNRFAIDAGFADAAAWTAFDTEAHVSGALAGLTGGTFDGRYAYFIPSDGKVAARFDSTLPFNDAGSWSTYPVASDGGEYLGVASDGKNLYAAPGLATAPVEKYALDGSFSDASSWTATPLASTTGRYQGMAFDGRYLYIVPYQATTIMQRLDTTVGTAWTALDLLKVSVDAGDGGSVALAGGVFDGQYLYFPTSGNSVPAIVRLEVTTTKQAVPAASKGGSFL